MCECLRGIFRVTWTPSSNTDSDRDQEDSHVYSQTRDPAVKDKRRSPPSSRSPSAPQRNPHHSGSTDEQESPERVVQKEKLHAELKQVLSQKRSHLRESTCQLAQPEMDSEPTDKQTCVEDTSQSVEIVVEAEAGASGYSVTGGGQRGIFVKDVLKDSPAAKHLSLQEGDQLLSAKVYFDNVKYEDALKILQCAEPYKVSFQLKRSIPGVEVCLRPRVPSVEVKGPKAKTAKMSVKGSKVFKAKKKRGGRFGLKRLKEKRREEMVIEGTPPMMEMSDVDVEFSLPKFKQKRSMKVEAEGARGAEAVGKAKRRIRFPHLKTKGYTEEDAGGKVETGQLEGQLNISSPAIPGAKVKTKGKGNKFGITFPRTKHTKSSLASETGSVELKPPSVTIQQPSVEFNLSGDKKVDVEKGGVKRNAPDVEFALPSGKAEASLPAVKGKAEIKVPKIDIKGGVDAGAAVGRADVDIGKGDTKLRMPKLKLPKVRLSRHSDEIDGDIKVKAKGMKVPHANIIPSKVEIKGGGEINLPEANITKPKMEGDPIQMPSVDISLPKVKGKSDMDVSLPEYEGAGKTAIKMPAIDISVPDVDFKLDTKHRIPDEVEGKISMPKIDMSLPKMGSSNVDIEGLEGGGKYSLPSVDISPPKVKTEVGDVDMHYYVGGDGKFKMPEFDISLPKCMPLEGDVNIKGEGFKLPKVDLTLPKDKAGTTDIEGVEKFQLPSFDISLPKIKTGEVVVGIEGPEVKGGEMPTLDISLPKGKMEGDIEVEGCTGKGGKVQMPTFDVSLPMLKQPEGHMNIETPKLEGEGKIKMPSLDISMPKGKLEGDVEIEGPSAKGGKFKMPHMKMPDVDISLPKGKIEGPEMEIKGQGGQFKMPHLSMPSVDISLPKGKIEGPEIEIEGGTGGKFKMPHMKMPSIDISLPKGKIEGPDVEIEGSTGGKLKMPHLKMPDVDISLPKGNIEGPEKKIKGDGGKFKMPHFSIPSVDISLPKGTIEGPDIEMEGGTGGKFKMPHAKMPKIDVSHPKGKIEVPDVEMEGGTGGKFKLPHWKMPDFYISLPKGKIEGPDTEIEGGTGGKFKMPKVDISLPKRKPSVEGPELDIGGHFKMPNVGISIPKGKESIDIPEEKMASDGGTIQLPHVNVPKVDISLPKGKSKAIEATAIEMEVTGGKFVGPHIKLPKEGVSVLKNKSGEGEINLSTAEAGGKVKVPQVPSLDLDIDVRLDKPKQDTEAHGEADLHVKGEHKALKLKMPTIDIKGPKGDLELDIGLNRGEGNKDRKKIELPDLDLNTTGTNSKVKGSKVKGTKFKIGMPKKKTGRDVTAEAKICKNCGDEEIGGKTKHRCMGKERFEYDVKLETHNGHKENKDRINIPVPEVTLPTKQGSAELGTGGEGSLSSSRGDSKVPRIPDIEFDITTSPDKYEDTTEKGKKIKIPKFGVALPSMSSPEGKINIFGPEIQYEGPKMPKVKKAVFVLVNPPQTGDHAACTGLQEKETTPGAEKEDVKVKMPKIKMKPSFGKPKDNAAALSFSPCKSGSFDVNLRGKGSTSSLNAEKDACPLKSSNGAKGTSSGKIKFPKVELTSPYGKMAAEGEDTEMSLKLGKDSSPGEVEGDTKGLQVQSGKMAVAGFSEELSKDVVSSRARTDMLDRDSSESPASFTMEFSSAKVQSWSKVESHSRESEERESSPWFKVPKFTLKPHSTGFLQITPEGSPQAQRKGEVGGEADVLGSFCLHTSGLDFTTQDVSEENQVCSTEDGTVTMVTKTTRITRHMVTSEAQTGESSATTTTTHQVSDFKH
ncbi:neuroblast differentiation-associated protein AHNAK isoform X8 [Etheostoma cragini]|uniref:neuroblast differentiation-associated protein AHNAK isoform X8 n=2 Tax=Etheostoma cragini TaxID=417921 RepID=UPI00155EAFCB|nr:neuroblast differentiation-associated protein AHNAK isoform X8 [Etheostoma cragini]